MALTKRSESKIVYLQVKHYCLWREIKNRVEGCDEVDANNPATGATVKKFGYRFDTVSGRALKLLKYDTEKKYSKRYFGFKLHLVDGGETFVLDMPYTSQILRRFLRLAPNVNWSLPLSISVFKGSKAEGAGVETTGIWFQQRGETVKAHFTREQPHGMPEAAFDPEMKEWDFKAQHRWLVERLKEQTIPDIEAAARDIAQQDEQHVQESNGDAHEEEPEPFRPGSGEIDDSDVPFSWRSPLAGASRNQNENVLQMRTNIAA